MAERNIHQRLNEVAKAVGVIGKMRKNPQQGFNFRGIDDVYNIIGPHLHDKEVVVYPEVTDIIMGERSTKSGTLMTTAVVTVRYTFAAPDGSTHTATLAGEGHDSGDKAVNKALSMAYKTAMLQVLAIPVEGEPDADADSPEPTPSAPSRSKPKTDPPTENLVGWLKQVAMFNTNDDRDRAKKLFDTVWSDEMGDADPSETEPTKTAARKMAKLMEAIARSAGQTRE